MQNVTGQKLALFGGPRAISDDPADMFKWPIITKEHEEAVLSVLRSGKMSDLEVTKAFEAEYAEMLGMKYPLMCNNGTAAIQSALYGMGVGVGDEVIVPSITYWASALQVYSLGASLVFADIDENTLCIDPDDIEHRITERTKVLIVVHYLGMPADMDRIMAIAEKHNLLVFEDCSHAHGALYKGKQVGTFGTASGFSLMSHKSLAVGEAGVMFTNDRRVWEKAVLFGQYARHKEITIDDLKAYTGLPCGGYKYRTHQLSSAFGRVQLKLYPKQMAEIDKAMNYFCDLLTDIPGVYCIRPESGLRTTKGGWYVPIAKYKASELGGLSVSQFVKAINAETVTENLCNPGCNKPLHTHPVFYEMDIYGHGRPTQWAHRPDVTGPFGPQKDLPVSERINNEVFFIPWFKHYRPKVIENYASAFKKVAANYEQLLESGRKSKVAEGGFSTSKKLKL